MFDGKWQPPVCIMRFPACSVARIGRQDNARFADLQSHVRQMENFANFLISYGWLGVVRPPINGGAGQSLWTWAEPQSLLSDLTGHSSELMSLTHHGMVEC